jgi:hypothetical protein
MKILFWILVLIIAAVIYIIYHKVMKVYYFSGKAFISEIIMILIISVFLAMILFSLLGSAITFIFSSIGNLIGGILSSILFILKWGLIICGIVLGSTLIKSILFKDKNNVNLDSNLKIDDNEMKNNICAPFKKSIELIRKDKKKLVIFVIAIIGLIAINSNTFSLKDSKEYYINMVKNMESGLDGYTLEEFLKSTFKEYGIEPNIEWNYIEDKQIVSVTLSDNTNSISRYYSVKNAPDNIEEVYIDGSSVNENLSNVIGDALEDRYYSSNYKDDDVNDKENDTLEVIEENYGYYKPNELGEKYATYMSESLANDDIETIKETVLEMFFINCSNTIGYSLNNYLEDIQFSDYQTEKGNTITIKGYSNKVGSNLMISILATYEGNVYLTEIRQGENNTMLDMSTQLEIADDMFK